MAGTVDTYNYLVPASGTTSGYPISRAFSATPFEVDFRFIELDGQSFVPSGVFIDNSAGIGDLVITIKTVNYSVTCPAGARLQTQYPAPLNQQASIIGNGQATVVFVDFPVIPFAQVGAGSLGNVTIANGGDVAMGNTADAAAVSPYANATAIALLKKEVTNTDNIYFGLGGNGDPVAASPFSSNWSLISVVKYIATAIFGWLQPSATSTITSVAGAVASTVILAANVNRRTAIFSNDAASGILYLRLNGTAATVANYTVALQPGATYIIENGDYTGEVRGIWSAATGFVNVTQITA